MRTTSSPQLLALLPVDRQLALPLHRQIYDGLRRAILERLLRPGQRVPATRVLAAELGVSRLPVLAAYEQLLHEGYLEGRVGSGTFVSAALPEESLTPVQRATRHPPEARPADRPAPQPRGREARLGPFRVSLPALDQFPRDVWARLIARHARLTDPAQMAYGDPSGLPVLRETIAEYLRTARAVRCEAEQVVVLSGSQAALRLCAEVLLRRGDGVAVEEPGYRGAHAALTTTGAKLVPVGVDQEGIDLTALRRIARRRRLRAAYVTPSHQYPLGVSMTAARRLALLEWARQTEAWLIEDDYDSEYRYVSRPLGALQGADSNGRVAYLGSFSKVLFPALRIGYLVVPPALTDRFLAARKSLDLFSPTLLQLTLADFLREGHFARHLRRMRGIYLRRRNALLAGLAEHCAGSLEVLNADAGLHVATRFTRETDDAAVVRRMEARGLTATPLSKCYLGREKGSGLLLGFGGFNEARIAAAARGLGAVIK